jgi:hypothetical protein
LSDNAKEKEYIKSLVQDLEVDQQVLAQNISAIQSGISMMDSMITILDNPSMIVNNTGTLYYLARLAPRLQPLPINDKTFQQLKNSGNFRLIKSIIASNKSWIIITKFHWCACWNRLMKQSLHNIKLLQQKFLILKYLSAQKEMAIKL